MRAHGRRRQRERGGFDVATDPGAAVDPPHPVGRLAHRGGSPGRRRSRRRLEPRRIRLVVSTSRPDSGTRAPSTVEPLVEPRSRNVTPSGRTVSSAWTRERSGSSTTRSASVERPTRRTPGRTSSWRPASGPATTTSDSAARPAGVRDEAGAGGAPTASTAPSTRDPEPTRSSGPRVLPWTWMSHGATSRPRSCSRTPDRSAAVAPSGQSTSTSSGSWGRSARTTVI